MKAFSFNVTIASDVLDTDVVEDTLRQALVDGLPSETLALVKADGVKEYSEQGWKVARNRKFGIGVKEAGDGHKATKSSKATEEAVA
jgi:hypothetical protein